MPYFILSLLVFLGLYLTIKLRFIQVRNLPLAFKVIVKGSSGASNNVALSNFAAIATIIGGNLGTGNISGVAIALTTGGPGALFWMAIIAVITSVIKYLSCFLSLKHRRSYPGGGQIGGPMYYIQYGLKSKWLAIAFAMAIIAAALSVGNFVQVNSLVLPLAASGIEPIYAGIGIAILVGLVVMGGLKRLALVITSTVPAMAIIYLISSIFVIFKHSHNIIPSLSLIIISAFTEYKTALGGVIGAFTSLSVGAARGVFATDIGLGLEGIIQSQVKKGQGTERNFCLEQSNITLISPLIVILICLVTGLVLLVTGTWQDPSLESTNMCIAAFNSSMPGNWFGHTITLTLFFFAYTTILTWFLCGERAVEYIAQAVSKTQNKFKKNNRLWPTVLWKIIFTLTAPLGALISVKWAWGAADIAISTMLLINLYSLARLSPTAIQEIKK